MKSTNVRIAEAEDQAIQDIFTELHRAERLHPTWPVEFFAGLCIIGEEYGEACQAAIESHFRHANPNLMYQEVLSIAATAIRFALAYKIQEASREGD